MDEEEKPFHGRIIWIERELSKVGINFACGGWRDPGGLHKSGEGGGAPEVDTSSILLSEDLTASGKNLISSFSVLIVPGGSIRNEY